MKSIRSILLIALFHAVTVSPVFAADELAQIKSSGVFRIGTEGTYAPFTYHDESGKLTGFDVEVGTQIAASRRQAAIRRRQMGRADCRSRREPLRRGDQRSRGDRRAQAQI
jgi:ABC-type amino acid transport substrate-binding protein